MMLTEKDIEFIKNDISARGITNADLLDDLTDHICCALEESAWHDFVASYNEILKNFGNKGFINLQEQTDLLTNKNQSMKNLRSLLGYFSIVLFTTGFTFKAMHWPGAAVMLVTGIVLFNFVFLPMYFFGRKQIQHS